jgi:hypothetical protein
MKKNHGGNVAFFHFPHYLFLRDHVQFREQLENAHNQNLQSFSYNDNGENITRLIYEMQRREYAKSLIEAWSLTDCLVKLYFPANKTSVDKKWTRVLATKFNNRMGKSIFDTQLTVSINQHYANEIRPEAKKVFLTEDYGYAAHFRDTDVASEQKPDNIMKFKITDATIDVEFLYFLIGVHLE